LAVRIRLKRMGAKKRPFYRLVVAPSTAPRDGRFIETIGYYNPLTDPATVQVDVEKALYWLEHGAQPTDTAKDILRQAGVLEAWQQRKAQPAGSTTVSAES